MTRWMHLLCWPLLSVGLVLQPGCERVENPATGEMEYTTLSPEQEKQIGEQQHPLILQQFGGEYPDPELQAYVDRIGNELAAASDLPDTEFTFTLLDSDVPNAFALPGGYVYITRGLLALAENEAEIAGVLGHEIGHVTGRHAAQRQTRATGAGLAATLGTIAAAIFGGEMAGQLARQAAGLGAQAYVASYSREQELEADQLGIRYLAGAGYEPRAMASFLEKLDEQSELEQRLAGGEGDPGLSWFATHPRTLDRVERAIEEIGGGGGGRVGRDEYLAAIDGLVYGENPAQGVVRGREFIHPDLGFAFEAPQGFQLANTPQAVIGRDRQGRQMLFTLADTDAQALDSYVAGPGLEQVARLARAEVSSPRGVETFKVDGMPGASASATLRQGNSLADVGLAAIDAGESAYQFIFISPGEMSRDEARAYMATVQSFRRLDEQETAGLQARRLRVVPVESGESAEQLAERMAVEEARRERFAILNALALRDGLSAGEQVKLVVD
jgi:predicted Zn-dependent protease